jgi:hypothetical protein
VIPDSAIPRKRNNELLTAAVESNPFRPDRAPAPIAFRMPQEERPASAPAAPVAVKLVGTAVMPGSTGFAMCQLGNQPPRVVRVGETIGDFTLKAVEQGRARFQTSRGTPVEIQVAKAGS